MLASLRHLLQQRWRWLVAGVLVALVAPVAWYLGSPLFINQVIDEEFPVIAAAAEPTATGSVAVATVQPAATPTPPPLATVMGTVAAPPPTAAATVVPATPSSTPVSGVSPVGTTTAAPASVVSGAVTSPTPVSQPAPPSTVPPAVASKPAPASPTSAPRPPATVAPVPATATPVLAVVPSTATPAPPTAVPATAVPATVVPATATPLPAQPVALLSGQFTVVDAVHQAEGTATIYRQPDGQHLLRFTNFRSANGPSLYVYLSGHPKPRSNGQFRDAGAIEIAPLKANIGNQNYVLPAGIDLAAYRSVVIYCKPFSVVFSTAELTRAS